MLSNRDLDLVAETTVHCTLDSFSALRRYGERAAPGSPVGLRFDSGVTASYGQHPKMVYGKSKFGFEIEECAEALAAAKAANLVVDSVAMHIGWGLPQESADLVDWAFSRLAIVAHQAPDLASINIGGGLGGRYLSTDQPLSLERWGAMIAKHLAPLGMAIVCEPGTWVVAPAGVLIVEVNTVETRRQIQWIGVNAGYSINPLPAMYDIPLEILPLRDPLAGPTLTAHVAGHINEGLDIWAKARLMAPVCEGDQLAFFPAGAYGSSMASNHCMRGEFGEVAVG
jgi:diaminopimelate decarboxylase